MLESSECVLQSYHWDLWFEPQLGEDLCISISKKNGHFIKTVSNYWVIIANIKHCFLPYCEWTYLGPMSVTALLGHYGLRHHQIATDPSGCRPYLMLLGFINQNKHVNDWRHKYWSWNSVSVIDCWLYATVTVDLMWLLALCDGWLYVTVDFMWLWLLTLCDCWLYVEDKGI